MFARRNEVKNAMDFDKFDQLIRGKHINFLIGAGASYPMYPTLDIGSKGLSFEDIISHPHISDKAKVLMYGYYFIKWIYPMRYDAARDFNDKDKQVYDNYHRFIKCLYNFLQGESNELPKRINIFTTNYDLLFEYSFDDFLLDNPLIYFNDGSRGVFKKYISNSNYYLNVSHSGYNDNYKREVPTVNLFKLHGSLSWMVDNGRIMITKCSLPIFEIATFLKRLELSLDDLDALILKCDDSNVDCFIENINDKAEIVQLSAEDMQQFFDNYKNIPIINPNKYKFHDTVSEQYYYQLIRSFSYELERKQSILIVFGFSFADEHIKDIFTRSLLNPELQVIIISYSKGGQDKLKSVFSGYRNITFLPEDISDGENGDFKYLLSLLGDTDDD